MPDIHSLIRRFHNAYQDKVDAWRHTLLRLKKQKNRVVLWGAGSKGVTFLNVLDISHKQIEYVVDLNPHKHGQFVAGTGQQVVAPDLLREYRPQTVIVMNPIYHAEIQQMIKDFGINAEIIDA
jgi:FlaA1/EpsC-like NDP-sugar epimerase